MKKICALLLALCSLLSLAACGKEKATSGQAEQKPAFSIPTEDGTEAPTQTPTEPTTIPTTEETEPPVQRYMEPIAAQYWADTKNGYHITESRKDPYKNQYLCIDAEGFVTVALDMDTEKVHTGVYDDVFVTTTDHAVYIRSAADGRIVFEYATDENTVAFPMADGIKDGYAMYIVHKSETYNGVSYEIGFVDTKGKWVFEMTSDSPLFDCFDDGGTLDAFREMRYCGENLMVFRGKEKEAFLFRIANNQILKITGLENHSFNELYEVDKIEFINGIGHPYHNWGTDEFTLPHSDGSGELLPNVFDQYDNRTDTSSAFFDRTTKTIYTLHYINGLSHEDSLLYVADNTGRILNQHLHTYVRFTRGFYGNGTAPVVIQNQEDTLFMAVLDTQGQFLYEPVKATRNHVCDASTGFIEWLNGSGLPVGTQFLGSNGQTLLEVDAEVYTVDLRNGILRYLIGYNERFLEVE